MLALITSALEGLGAIKALLAEFQLIRAELQKANLQEWTKNSNEVFMSLNKGSTSTEEKKNAAKAIGALISQLGG